MADRSKEDIAAEMAKHHLALGALWAEFSRADGGGPTRKSSKPRESVTELRNKVARRVNSKVGNGST